MYVRDDYLHIRGGVVSGLCYAPISDRPAVGSTGPQLYTQEDYLRKAAETGDERAVKKLLKAGVPADPSKSQHTVSKPAVLQTTTGILMLHAAPLNADITSSREVVIACRALCSWRPGVATWRLSSCWLTQVQTSTG